MLCVICRVICFGPSVGEELRGEGSLISELRPNRSSGAAPWQSAQKFCVWQVAQETSSPPRRVSFLCSFLKSATRWSEGIRFVKLVWHDSHVPVAFALSWQVMHVVIGGMLAGPAYSVLSSPAWHSAHSTLFIAVCFAWENTIVRTGRGASWILSVSLWQ